MLYARLQLTEPGTPGIIAPVLPKWRNGRRGGLKNRSGQPGVGSSPTFGTIRHQGQRVGAWLSLVERRVRVAEVGGSNPLAPTRLQGRLCLTQALLFAQYAWFNRKIAPYARLA